jgi:hypothetical protein
VCAAREDLERSSRKDPPLTEEQRDEIHRLSRNFAALWEHPDTPTTLRKQLLRVAIREVVVRLDTESRQLKITVHWAGDACTSVAVTKRATPVGSKADSSLTELVHELAQSLDDGEIARILNMKKMTTPRGLRWSQDRVRAFRSHHRIRRVRQGGDPDVLTGQQARDYLGIGYNGLMALVRRGVVHTNQVTDFAPWRIEREELDSEPVKTLVATLKTRGRLPPQGGSPEGQGRLFPTKSTPL